jgi:hypothetical protein
MTVAGSWLARVQALANLVGFRARGPYVRIYKRRENDRGSARLVFSCSARRCERKRADAPGGGKLSARAVQHMNESAERCVQQTVRVVRGSVSSHAEREVKRRCRTGPPEC